MEQDLGQQFLSLWQQQLEALSHGDQGLEQMQSFLQSMLSMSQGGAEYATSTRPASTDDDGNARLRDCERRLAACEARIATLEQQLATAGGSMESPVTASE